MIEITAQIPDWIVILVSISLAVAIALEAVKTYLRWQLWKLKRDAAGADDDR